MSELDTLMREVRERQDAELEDPRRRLTVRNRLLAAPERRTAPRRPPLWVAFGSLGVAAAAAVALFVFVPWTDHHPHVGEGALTFTVDARPRAPGSFLEAPVDAPMDVAFSDGSTVALAPRSTGRVESVDSRGARLLIEHGEAEVNVVHRESTRWLVQSGPYTVRVVGTRFRVAWDAARRRFELDMREGEVAVVGPGLAERRLSSGESLAVGPEPTAEAAPGPTVTADPEPVVPVEAAASESHAADTAQSHGSARTAASAEAATAIPARPDWRELARRGEYRSALASLDEDALASALANEDAVRLSLLGTAARQARDLREARVYRALRDRFAGTEEASDAAFHLARHAMRQRAAADAVPWLRTYLAERPQGEWAEEAQGRLVQALAQLGRAADAEAEADRYLASYPSGEYAELARSVRER